MTNAAAALEFSRPKTAWNPFRCRGMGLPPHVLLAVKLIAIVVLFDQIEDLNIYRAAGFGSGLTQFGAKLLCIAASLPLLFNCWVRPLAAVLGLGVLYQYALLPWSHLEAFVGLFLVLAALMSQGNGPRILRYLVVLLHAFTGLYWLLGPAVVQLSFTPAGNPASVAAPSGAPGPLDLAPALAAIHFAIAGAFLLPRLYPLGIWAGIVLFSLFILIYGPTVDVSVYAILSSYLVFVWWPRDPLVVIYDGDCGFCNKTREWLSRFDFEGLYDWRPFQSGVGAEYGIAEKALEDRAHVIAGESVHAGFRAFRMMALYNPVTHLGAAAVLFTMGAWIPAVRDGVFVALVVFFSPLVYPVGEAVYEWVARNRHRLPPRTCEPPAGP